MRLTALCLVGALLAALLRRTGGEMALLLALAVCGAAVMLLAQPLEELKGFWEEAASWGQLPVQLFVPLVKTVGIALLCRTGSDLCRDAGESAIRWQQTPMMPLLGGLAARETVGQYFHETADMVQGGMPLQCAWEQVFEKMPDGEAGEILARLRLGGDRERLVGALGQTRQELEELYRRRCREDGQRSRVTTAAALCGAGLVIILLI